MDLKAIARTPADLEHENNPYPAIGLSWFTSLSVKPKTWNIFPFPFKASMVLYVFSKGNSFFLLWQRMSYCSVCVYLKGPSTSVWHLAVGSKGLTGSQKWVIVFKLRFDEGWSGSVQVPCSPAPFWKDAFDYPRDLCFGFCKAVVFKPAGKMHAHGEL